MQHLFALKSLGVASKQQNLTVQSQLKALDKKNQLKALH